MKFGENLRSIRLSRYIKQKDLAAAAGFSPALLSRFESGKQVPTEATARKLLRALGIEERSQEDLLALRDEDEAAQRRVFTKRLTFGEALTSVLGRSGGPPVATFVQQVQRSALEKGRRPPTRAAVYAWLSGRLLPGDETFAEELQPILQAAGASDDDLRKLKLAHMKDVLARSLELAYLTEQERMEITDYIGKCLENRRSYEHEIKWVEAEREEE